MRSFYFFYKIFFSVFFLVNLTSMYAECDEYCPYGCAQRFRDPSILKIQKQLACYFKEIAPIDSYLLLQEPEGNFLLEVHSGCDFGLHPECYSQSFYGSENAYYFSMEKRYGNLTTRVLDTSSFSVEFEVDTSEQIDSLTDGDSRPCYDIACSSPLGNPAYALESYSHFLAFCSFFEKSLSEITHLTKETIQKSIQGYQSDLRKCKKDKDFALNYWKKIRGSVFDEAVLHQYILEEINRQKNALLKIESSHSQRLEILAKYEPKIHQIYHQISDFCLRHHAFAKAYYAQGLYHFHHGNFYEAFENIEVFLEKTQKDDPNLYMTKGISEAELGLYQNAIESLSQAIELDCENKQAYFERAACYFEKGDFDQALQDFLQSNLKISPLHSEDEHALDFAKGLFDGSLRGIHEGAINFFPSLLGSLQGLSHGIWSMVSRPVECSSELVHTCKECIQLLQDSSAQEILTAIVPELKELIQNPENISNKRQGEVLGYVIGKYGIEVFAITGSIKALKAYHNLRKANAVLSLEKLTKEAKQARMMKEAASAWNQKHLESVQKFQQAKDFLKPYKGQYLTENQARKILHQAGFKTFTRPKGVPKNFKVKLSNKGGGIKYVHPVNEGVQVRVMPGKPHSPFPNQQKPYVVHVKDGKAFDKFGNKVNKSVPEAHIPLDEFIYRIN